MTGTVGALAKGAGSIGAGPGAEPSVVGRLCRDGGDS